MATTEKIGLMTTKDSAGNVNLLYPITKVEAVDGLEEKLATLDIDVTTMNSDVTTMKTSISDLEANVGKDGDGNVIAETYVNKSESYAHEILLGTENDGYLYENGDWGIYDNIPDNDTTVSDLVYIPAGMVIFNGVDPNYYNDTVIIYQYTEAGEKVGLLKTISGVGSYTFMKSCYVRIGCSDCYEVVAYESMNAYAKTSQINDLTSRIDAQATKLDGISAATCNKDGLMSAKDKLMLYNVLGEDGTSLNIGYLADASTLSSAAIGYDIDADACQVVIGRYNCAYTADGSIPTSGANGTAFVIGNGTEDERSNAFRVDYDGTVIGLRSYITGGADFAEYREWLDGNPDDEDRVGYFVTQVGKKIVKANPGDWIRGVVSGNPGVIGNGDEGWAGRYLRDEFGRILYEEITVTDPTASDTDESPKTITCKQMKINPDYDPTMSYVSRKNRKEYGCVGMKGLLPVRDDGTCEVDGFCKVADGGIATAAEWSEGSYQHPVYRVVNRVTDNVVEIEM